MKIRQQFLLPLLALGVVPAWARQAQAPYTALERATMSIRRYYDGDYVGIVRILSVSAPIPREVVSTPELTSSSCPFISYTCQVLSSNDGAAGQRITALQPYRKNLTGHPLSGPKPGDVLLLGGTRAKDGRLSSADYGQMNPVGLTGGTFVAAPNEVAANWLTPTDASEVPQISDGLAAYFRTRLQSLERAGPSAVSDAIFFQNAKNTGKFLPELEGETPAEWIKKNVAPTLLTYAGQEHGTNGAVLAAIAVDTGAPHADRLLVDRLAELVESDAHLDPRESGVFLNIYLYRGDTNADEMVHLAVRARDHEIRRFLAFHIFDFPHTELGYKDFVSLAALGDTQLQKNVLGTLASQFGRPDLSPTQSLGGPVPDRAALLKYWQSQTLTTLRATQEQTPVKG